MADAASGSGVLVDLEFQVTGIQQYNVDGKPKQRFKIRVRDYSTSQEWYICKSYADVQVLNMKIRPHAANALTLDPIRVSFRQGDMHAAADKQRQAVQTYMNNLSKYTQVLAVPEVQEFIQPLQSDPALLHATSIMSRNFSVVSEARPRSTTESDTTTMSLLGLGCHNSSGRSGSETWEPLNEAALRPMAILPDPAFLFSTGSGRDTFKMDQ